MSPGAGPERPLPPVDFSTFVLSVAQAAVQYMGEPVPAGGASPAPDLAFAKHNIDLLSMLQEKTKGNLTSAEERLLESVLFDLRLRYVEATKKA